MIRFFNAGICGIVIALFLGGCATTSPSSVQERRHKVLTMKSDVLTELYRLHPQAEQQIASAPGYAVFSNANVNIIFASFSGGYGVVQEKSGKQTYMKMGGGWSRAGSGRKGFSRSLYF